MKKLMIFATALLALSMAEAQKSSRTRRPPENPFAAKGLQLELLKPVWESTFSGKAVTKSREEFEFNEDSYRQYTPVGIGIGYGVVPKLGVGAKASLTHYLVTETREHSGLTKISGDLVIGLLRELHLFGGPNVSLVTAGPGSTGYKPEIGGQIGAGLQIDRKFALTLSYQELNQTGELSFANSALESGSASLKIQAVELGLTATF